LRFLAKELQIPLRHMAYTIPVEQDRLLKENSNAYS
jgi:hypothetical protein